MLELPAGLVDEGENPLTAAKRELLEETGYKAAKWEQLTSIYTSPGSHNEKIYIYSASELSKISDQNLDEDEILYCSKVPFNKVMDMALKGGIKDAKSIIGIFLYHIHN